jgi:hypothetical protein
MVKQEVQVYRLRNKLEWKESAIMTNTSIVLLGSHAVNFIAISAVCLFAASKVKKATCPWVVHLGYIFQN